MRVVICNKYFFLNGGTERYMRNVMGQLTARGHDVVPFSVAYANSWHSPYSPYFLPPPGPADAIYLKDLRPGFKSTLTHLGRAIYSPAARRSLSRLLDAVDGADAAYVLNIYNYMSPSILDTFKKRGIRVIMRLGDYNLLCANYKLLRQGQPCTLCVGGAYHHGLRHRCVHGSLPASVVRVTAMYVQRLLGVYDAVHTFVAPCTFMRDRLVEGGISPNRIAILRQPADPGLVAAPDTPKTQSILFFGRITEEKGLDVLLQAYQRSGVDADLHIVGRSYDGCLNRLRRLISHDHAGRIHLHEFMTAQELSPMISQALLCVVPSRYHDNAPQSVMESYLHATPVLGAAMGGIPEEIIPGRTGELFTSGDVEDLAAKLKTLLADPERLVALGREARRFALEERSFARHIEALVPLLSGQPATTEATPCPCA